MGDLPYPAPAEVAVERGRRASLLRAVRDLAALRPLPELLQGIARGCAEVLESPSVALRVLEGHELVLAATWGDAAPMATTRLQVGESLSGRVATTGEPLVVEDVADDPRLLPAHREPLLRGGYTHWLGVPVTLGTRVLGVLSIRWPRRTVTPADVALAMDFAAQAAVALENARLYEEAQRRREELAALWERAERRARNLSTLAELARTLAVSRDPAATVQAVIRAAATLTGAAFGRVWLDDPAQGCLRAGATFAASPRLEGLAAGFRSLGYGQGVGGAAFATGEPQFITDLAHDARWLERELIETGALRACAALPLVAEARRLGVLVLLFREPHPFAAEDRELLGLLADHAAMALRNAQAFAQERAAREAAEAAERRYQTLFDGVPVGLFRLSDTGTLQEANRALVEVLGYPGRSAVVGLTLEQLLAEPAELPRCADLLRRGDLIQGLEVALRRADGSARWVRIRARAVVDAHTGSRSWEGVLEDITALRHVESELLRAQKLELVGRLAGGIAHDFNNLLTVIRGRSLLLLERLREAGPSRRDAELIEATARRAASLTSKLLAFSRRQVLQPRAVDLSRLLGELVPVLQRLLGEQIRLHTHLPPGVVTRVDPALFEQVVVNLVVNARDAMPGGGELRLATALVEVDEGRARDAQVAPGRYAVVAVTDTGTGMTDEVRRHLFEPFFTTKDPGRGTGLGLSSVHAVVRQHGGFVAVETALRVGTTFEVYVPATAEPPVPVEPERVAAPGAVAPATILVVEDDLDVRHTIREVLERLGHTVLEAGHPEVARVIADTHPGRIDLVLTDAVLPGTSGLAMANALAQRRPETRLLVMSGYAEAPDAQSLVEAAGRPLLRKPFTPDELAAAVQTALS